MLRRFAGLLPVGALYGGRVGIALLGLVVLPWFARSMPASDFGLVATILAFQALAVVLDLGLSLGIAREIPILTTPGDRRALIRRSEGVLLRLYLGVTILVLFLSWVRVLALSPAAATMLCLSLLVIVWQNLLSVALAGQRHFTASVGAQFGAIATRHLLSLALVVVLDGGVQAFLLGQALGGLAALILTRTGYRLLNSDAADSCTPIGARPANIVLMVYSVAGACALQLDKPLLSTIASPEQTGPYFLASTMALVPITFLAAPLSQFVQPRLIASLARNDQMAAARAIAVLTAALVALAVLPGIAMGLAAGPLVTVWLQDSANAALVARYISLMMPGAAIGTLGLVPAVALLACQDYRGLAAISCIAGIAVLGATALLAGAGDLEGVCRAYAGYHAVVALMLWLRAWRRVPAFSPRLLALSMNAANRNVRSLDGPGHSTADR